MKHNDPTLHQQMFHFAEAARMACAADGAVIALTGYDETKKMPLHIVIQSHKDQDTRSEENEQSMLIYDLLGAASMAARGSNVKIHVQFGDGEIQPFSHYRSGEGDGVMEFEVDGNG